MKMKLGMAVGIAISAAILGYLLWQLQWGLFMSELSKVRLIYLPILILLFLFSFFLRALRWRYLLPTGLEISTMRLFSACVLGMLASCVLPLRAGEFVRPWVLSRSKQVSFSLGFSSVVTERVFDVLAMLSLFIAVLGTVENPPAWAPVAAYSLGMIALVILAVMLTAYFRAALVLRIATTVISGLFARRAPKFSAKLFEMAAEFIDGLKAISSLGQLLSVLLLSAVLWLEFSVLYYIGLLSFGVSPAFSQANAVNVFVALAIAVPSAPGFLGTFQVGCLAALHEIYHYSEEFAVAYSVVMHSFQMICSVLLGIVMLRYEGLSFKQLSSRGE